MSQMKHYFSHYFHVYNLIKKRSESTINHNNNSLTRHDKNIVEYHTTPFGIIVQGPCSPNIDKTAQNLHLEVLLLVR
jgi:hypothetical protein